MTDNRFFELFEKTGDYEISIKDGSLRRCEDGSCPIIAVYKDFYNVEAELPRYENEDAWQVGSRILGLSQYFTNLVIESSDNNCYNEDQHDIRDRLVRAKHARDER